MKLETKTLNIIGWVAVLGGLWYVGSYGISAGADIVVALGLVAIWYCVYQTKEARNFGWWVNVIAGGYLSAVYVYNFTSVVFGF
jgi:hypothetical protein